MQGNNDEQTRNIQRTWLRWVVASVVGGVVSSSFVFIIPFVLTGIVAPPQPGLDIRFLQMLVCFFVLGLFICGPIGALAHWLLVGRPIIDAGRWITKWSMGCWLGLIGVLVVVFLVTNVNVEPIERFVNIIGGWTAYTLASAAFGLILSAILGDTRPWRGKVAPGPHP